MKSITIITIIAATLLSGCRRNDQTLPGLAIRIDKLDSPAATEEVTMLTVPGDRLICRMITETGRVVSVMPTPIGSDDLHSYGPFRPTGDGWTEIVFLTLSEHGSLSYGKQKGALDSDTVKKIIGANTPIYLTVEQNTAYSDLLAVVRQLAARTNAVFGVGYKGRYPDVEVVDNAIGHKDANNQIQNIGINAPNSDL